MCTNCLWRFILCIIPIVYIIARICGVMASVLASSVADHGLEHWSGQTKDCTIGIWSFFAKYQH